MCTTALRSFRRQASWLAAPRPHRRQYQHCACTVLLRSDTFASTVLLRSDTFASAFASTTTTCVHALLILVYVTNWYVRLVFSIGFHFTHGNRCVYYPAASTFYFSDLFSLLLDLVLHIELNRIEFSLLVLVCLYVPLLRFQIVASTNIHDSDSFHSNTLYLYSSWYFRLYFLSSVKPPTFETASLKTLFWQVGTFASTFRRR